MTTAEERETQRITDALARLAVEETEAAKLADAKSLLGKLEYHKQMAAVLRQKWSWMQRQAQISAPPTIPKALADKLAAAGIEYESNTADVAGIDAILDADMTPAEKKAIIKAGLATRETKRVLSLD